MPEFENGRVKLCGGIVVWDGVTRPEVLDDGGNKWSLKILVPPGSQDIQSLSRLALEELQSSEFKGVLPQGGYMPVGTVGAHEYNGQYNGWSIVNCTTFRSPDVYDANGSRLDPMQYGPLVYSGQQVDVLVHCKAYNNKSKGVAARMDAFEPIVAANAPQQSFGGGCNTGAAFGQNQNQQPAQNNQQPAQNGGQPYQQPAQNNQQPAQNGGQPYQQPAQNGGQPQQGQPYQQPAQNGGQPQQGQPYQQPAQNNQYQQQPAQNQPPAQNTQYQQPAQNNPPQQAQDFLPNQQ